MPDNIIAPLGEAVAHQDQERDPYDFDEHPDFEPSRHVPAQHVPVSVPSPSVSLGAWALEGEVPELRLEEEDKYNYIETGKMIADIFTKPLGKLLFERFRAGLGVMRL